MEYARDRVRSERGSAVSDLAVNWEGEYALYERPEDWLPRLETSRFSPWILGQMIFASHNEGSFRTRAFEKRLVAGSSMRLRLEGVTPLAPLAILSGRLDGDPLDLFGKVTVPYCEELDALVSIPREAEGGTYIFLAQQWEPGGRPAYPGGAIYPSSATAVEVRPYVDAEEFWKSFEPWPEDDAEEIRENIRRAREGLF